MNDATLTLMAVHAHPDDEVFSTGGVLARTAAEGLRTVLVCATGGEVGEIRDPDLDPGEARERLAAIREQELRQSCAILHIGELYLLGYRDSGMVGTPDNADPRNFHNADPEEATARLTRLIRQVRPHVVVTYDERGGYGHPDHIATHRTTLAAVEAAADPARFPAQELPAWNVPKLYVTAIPRSAFQRMREALAERGLPTPFGDDFDITSMTAPDEAITTRVDVGDYAAQKLEALRVHRTQISADHFMLAQPEDITRQMLGFEAFIRVRSLVAAPAAEDDLFAGLR